MNLTWNWKLFNELSTHQLCQILRLRQQVFVVEQQCCYEDIDGWDERAVHLMGTDDVNGLVAYCRVFAPDVRFAEANIGRILTSASVRGAGLGHELLRRSKAWCDQNFPNLPVRIAAQAHLQGFYGSHGFVTDGPEYPVDEIPHVDMFLRQA
jgi:ElaA protein